MKVTQDIEGAPTPEEIKEKINARLTALRERRSEVQHEALAIDAEIAQLEAARAAINGTKKPGSKRKRAAKPSDPERRAGAGNVRRVEETLVSLGGRATQHEITERSGMNSGTVSYALKALRARKHVRTTGKRVRRSPEYEIVGSTTAPPGT